MPSHGLLIDVVRTVQDQGRQKTHAAQRCTLLIGRQKRVNKIAVVALWMVGSFGPAGGCHQPQIFALQNRTALTVGPTIGEHVVKPELLQSRHGVPLNRVQQHNQLRFGDRSLFPLHINIVVRVT